MKLNRIISSFLLFSVAVTTLAAQDALYKWDMGVSAGMSGYTGEANDGFIFRRPGFTGALNGRYCFNTRLSLSGNLAYIGLSGDTKGMDNVYPAGENYRFTSSVYSLDISGEFNFFPYGVGETYKRLRRWTPYVGIGVGGLMSRSEGKTSGAFQMPLRLGVKMKLQDRLNLNITLTAAKVFGDRLDGELSDLYTIKSSFLKNTDWYSTLTVGLTYEFGERCPTCHRVN